MGKKHLMALVIPSKPISEIREIAHKFGLGKIKDIRTSYHPYVHFRFTYDRKKGLLRRTIFQKEGESVLDSNWRSYPIKDFEFFSSGVYQTYALRQLRPKFFKKT